MDYVPVCAPEFSWKLDKKGIVVIEMENKGFYNWLAQKLFKRPRFSHISLDEYGSFIWQQMDGKKSIYEISKLVKEKVRGCGGTSDRAPDQIFSDSL